MFSAAPADCFASRMARVGRAMDQREWASGHALLTGLRQCGLRHGCADGESCASAAELLLNDVRGMLREQVVAPPPQP